MDPLALTAGALREPWRLWTCHLVHFGWGHALANAFALSVPLLLAHRQDRPQRVVQRQRVGAVKPDVLPPARGGNFHRVGRARQRHRRQHGGFREGQQRFQS